MKHIYSSNNTIIVDTYDMLSMATRAYSKVDMLLYNQINEDGYVLSSVVYVSNKRALDDTSPIVYDPSNLLPVISIPGKLTDDFTFINNKQYLSEYSFRKSRAAGNEIKSYDFKTDYVPYGNGDILVAGWYTMQSIAVPKISTYHNLMKGEWGQRDSTKPVVYATIDMPSEAQVRPIYDIENQAANVYGSEAVDHHFKKEYEFFSLGNMPVIYSKMPQKDHYPEFMSLRAKYRSVEHHINQGNYGIAQYITQSMDYALISQIV
jgi:hypothetical protein